VVRGRGVAVGEYGPPPAGATWVAMVVEVEVDQTSGRVRVPRVVVAHDCGLIVNPDGVRNQIEGNVLQGLSRTLHEEVTWDRSGVTSLDWRSYPILTFSEVPEVDIVLLNHTEGNPRGAGEAATILTGAAVANAVFDATGVRLRRVPFIARRVQAPLEQRG
jgi:nicotinate dehydrogenase subunit B